MIDSSINESSVMPSIWTMLEVLETFLSPPIEVISVGLRVSDFDYLIYNNIKKWQTAVFVYINKRAMDDDERTVMIHPLLKGIKSSCRTNRIVSMMFFSEMLRRPGFLKETIAEDVVTRMAGYTRSSDEREVFLAIEALENASKGAPSAIITCKHIIFDNLYQIQLNKNQDTICIRILQALSTIVRQIKCSNLGSQFTRIIIRALKYFDSPNKEIQLYCTALVTDLAQNCDENMRCFVNKVIRSCLCHLFIKTYSTDKQVRASGIAALLHSLPYIGCKDMTHVLSADAKHIWKLYERLGQKDPVLLKEMMIQTVNSLSFIQDLHAAVSHLKRITDALPYEKLEPLDLKTLWKGLMSLTKLCSKCPLYKAATCAVEILQTKWKSLGTDELNLFSKCTSFWMKSQQNTKSNI